MRRSGVQARACGEYFFKQQEADYDPCRWGSAAPKYTRAFGKKFEAYAASALKLLEDRRGSGLGDLLDIGCGTGAAAAVLSRNSHGVQHLYCTDFAEEMVEGCRGNIAEMAWPKGVRVDVEVMDGQNLRFADSSFDTAIALFSLLFFRDRQRGMREMRRVLRPGGLGVIGSWAPVNQLEWVHFSNKALVKVLGGHLPPARPPPGYNANFQALSNTDEFQQQMLQAGFRDVEVVTVTKTFYFPDSASLAELWQDMAVAFPTIAFMLEDVDKDTKIEVATEFARLVGQRGQGAETVECYGYLKGTALMGVGAA